MKESNVQTIFGKKNKIHGVFELKLAKGTSIPFKSVAEHQVEALKKASGSGLYHKIQDAPFGHSGFRFHAPRPFDCVFLQDTPAYVVIVWYVPRQPREFQFILIDDWTHEKNTSTRKSLTRERGAEIALYIKHWKDEPNRKNRKA